MTQRDDYRDSRRDARRLTMSSSVADFATRDHAVATDLDRVRVGLVDALRAESATAELMHALLVLVLGAVVWGSAPPALVFGWIAAVWGAVLIRRGLRRAMSARKLSVRGCLVRVRVSVALVGTAWGVGALVVSPFLGVADLLLVMVVFAGLGAGGTATLSADVRGFFLFATPLLGLLVVGILRHGSGQTHVAAVALTSLFFINLVVIVRRAHGTLRRYLTVTEELSTQSRLITRERSYLDALVSSAPTAIAAVDAEGMVSLVNPAFERLFGYPADQVIGRDLNDLIVPTSERDSAERLEAELWGDGVVVTEVERQHRDGYPIPVRVSAASVQRSDQDTIFVLYDDITETMKARDALQKAEAQYRRLVQTASDLVWEVDADGRWTFLNAAAERIYGAPPEQLLGRPFTERVAPDHVTTDREAFGRLIAEAESGIIDHETVHVDLDGKPRTLSFSASVIRDAEDRAIGARGIARDVTERVAMRDALQRAREEAERAAEAKASFLANMSHEIRTPMNGVVGMVDLLLDTELQASQIRMAETVKTSAEALLGVIDDVLDYSKIEADAIELEAIPFDVVSLTESVTRLLATRAVDKGIELHCDVGAEIPRIVRGDPTRLRQVLSNLVSNAIKFTETGEIVLAVKLQVQADRTVKLTFQVRDTGIGISSERLESIFAEFNQADVSTTRRYGGTGLGLTISRRLVQLMGDDLRVSSTEGEGSTFSFDVTFPVESQVSPEAPQVDVAALRGRRTLIVDDSATNRRILRGILQAAGMVVDEAPLGKTGFDLAVTASEEERGYDLVVLDWQMPDWDGFKVARAIVDHAGLAGTKLMMLTSGGRRGDGQRCRNLGIRAYLTKPVGRTELVEAVAMVLLGGDAPHERALVTKHSIEEARQHLRILLAEDNEINQEVAASMLTRRGHRVDVVDNGRDAVRAVASQSYDVVLMDVQMPELDGLGATRAIREELGFADLPILALTAHVLDDERRACLDAGMSAVVRKPFKPHELFAAVEGWLTPVSAEESSPQRGADPVRLHELREMLREAGIESTLPRLIEVFLKNAPAHLLRLAEASAGDDPEAMRSAAHAYKSAAGTIAAHELADLLQRVEHAGKAGDVRTCRELLGAVRDEHQRVCEALTDSDAAVKVEECV